MVIELLLVAGAAATGVCFVRGDRRLGLIGVAAGVAALLLYLILGSLLESALPGLAAAGAYAVGMALAAAQASVRSGPAGHREGDPHRGRGTIIGALIGMAPGVLVLIVPLLLHAAGVITSDQSQVGFLGIFFIPAGMLAGGLVGALTPPRRADRGGEDAAKHTR